MGGWAERIRSDPTALIGREPSVLHEVFDEVDAALGRRPGPLLAEVPGDRPIQVIGDSHGDWPAVQAAVRYARRGALPDRLVALGDYVDRATRSQPDPTTLPNGSVWEAAYLLAWTAHDPDGIVLLRGNHEATRQIPVPAPTLLREMRRAYPGPEGIVLWERLVGLLERLPLAARTAHGVFLAHGGIPPAGRYDPRSWDRNDLALLEGLFWSDPELDFEGRDVGFAYDEPTLGRFLEAIGCRMMVKGHAPGHSGRAIYGGRLLTLHTSDLFSGWGEGGVLMGEIPPLDRVEHAGQLGLRAWNGSEWRSRAIRIDPAAPPTSIGTARTEPAGSLSSPGV